jgi:hypothetical protein
MQVFLAAVFLRYLGVNGLRSDAPVGTSKTILALAVCARVFVRNKVGSVCPLDNRVP